MCLYVPVEWFSELPGAHGRLHGAHGDQGHAGGQPWPTQEIITVHSKFFNNEVILILVLHLRVPYHKQ